MSLWYLAISLIASNRFQPLTYVFNVYGLRQTRHRSSRGKLGNGDWWVMANSAFCTFICNNISLLHKLTYSWDKNSIILVKITFVRMFLWWLDNGEWMVFLWQLMPSLYINPFRCDCRRVSCKSRWYNKNSFNR